MPMFKLRATENNLRIAEFLETAERGVKVERHRDEILVKFKYGFTITLLEVGSIIRGFTRRDWRNLIKEAKETIVGGKVQEFSDASFGVRPTKSERIYIRLDPLEKETIQEAAVLEGKSLSEFIRSAALKAASEAFDKETAMRMMKRKQKENSHAYVS